MADETIAVPSFDLGISNSETFGDLKAAEAFLNDTAIKVKEGEELEEIDEEEETPPVKKKPSAKKEEKKPSAVELAEKFLNDEEDPDEEEEEEDDEEAQPAGKTKTPAPKEKEEDTPEDSNSFESFSKELYTLNVLSTEEGEEPVIAKTGEELLELLNKEKQKGAIAWLDNFLEQHGEDRRELFEAIFIKGADPKEYLPVYNQTESLKDLDLENEANQEKVMREFYRRAGVAEEKIAAKIQRLKDTADLQSEAEEFHPQLVAQDEQKLKDIADAAEQELRIKNQIEETYKNSLMKLISEKAKGKDYDGIPINPKAVQASFDALYTKKWKTADGQLLTDFDKIILESKKPENVDKRLKFMLLEQIGWDFSKIEKKAISKESNQLFNSLVKQKDKEKTKEKNKQTFSEGW